MGAICDVCGEDMEKAAGCDVEAVIVDGKKYDLIKTGDEDWVEEGQRCHDCGAKFGHYHHPGCDVERCPICGGQFISCGCLDGKDYRDVIDIGKEKEK